MSYRLSSLVISVVFLILLSYPVQVDSADLSISLSVSPSSGTVPLNVVLKPQVAGSATGDIFYKIDCNSADSTEWDSTFLSNDSSPTISNLCTYSAAGTYIARVQAERDGLVELVSSSVEAQPLTMAASLNVSPSSGTVPLAVTLNPTVSGTATGDISYKIDCNISDGGSWDNTFVTNDPSPSISNLCSYSSAGDYKAKIVAERQGLSAEAEVQITASAEPTVSVSLSAIPSSGKAPLSVTLKPAISGTAQGLIEYKLDCNAFDGLDWDTVFTSTDANPAIENVCNYTAVGTHTATVNVSRAGKTSSATAEIAVTGEESSGSGGGGVPSAQTLDVTLNVSPSSGTVPLVVTLNPTVSGTATGDISYKIDCNISDGLGWDNTFVSNDPSPSISNLCSYSSAGAYVIKVEVERQGLKREATTQIGANSVSSPSISLAVSGSIGGGSVYEYVRSQPVPADSGKKEEEKKSDFVLDKTVRNKTKGEVEWKKIIAADLEDILSFRIDVKNTGNVPIKNIVVKDILDQNLAFVGNVYSTRSFEANIFSGITVPEISAGESFVLTFDTKVSSQRPLKLGTSLFLNVVLAYNTQKALTDVVTVKVKKIGPQPSNNGAVPKNNGGTVLPSPDLNLDATFTTSATAAVIAASINPEVTGDVVFEVDCQNDGTFESTLTTKERNVNLPCLYSDFGSFTAKVRALKNDKTSERLVAINIPRPSQDEVGQLSSISDAVRLLKNPFVLTVVSVIAATSLFAGLAISKWRTPPMPPQI